MNRRQMIAALGGAAAWPIAASAQQAGMPVVGFLCSESPEAAAIRVHAFHRGLNEAGYVEGRNIVVEYRWAEGQNDRLPALAANLVHRNVAAIASVGVSCRFSSKGGNDDDSNRLPGRRRSGRNRFGR
jgi:putative ABC transport system substrate-binding protein